MANTEFNVDISTLLRILKKYVVVIIVFTVVGVITAALLAEVVIPKRYSAKATFYVENRQVQGEVIQVADITAARNLVATCARLFTMRDSIVKLKEATDVPYSVEELAGMIGMGVAANIEFLDITITASNSNTAVYLLDHFLEICVEVFNENVETGNIRVADSAFSSGKPVFPNLRIFVAVGFLLGFILTYLTVFVIEILDTKVKAEDDLFRIYDIPVFAEVMSFDAKLKGEYSYE
jgi:capsular polysaccharide biosynthesis protein